MERNQNKREYPWQNCGQSVNKRLLKQFVEDAQLGRRLTETPKDYFGEIYKIKVRNFMAIGTASFFPL